MVYSNFLTTMCSFIDEYLDDSSQLLKKIK